MGEDENPLDGNQRVPAVVGGSRLEGDRHLGMVAGVRQRLPGNDAAKVLRLEARLAVLGVGCREVAGPDDRELKRGDPQLSGTFGHGVVELLNDRREPWLSGVFLDDNRVGRHLLSLAIGTVVLRSWQQGTTVSSSR
jgi:hypothetical protein